MFGLSCWNISSVEPVFTIFIVKLLPTIILPIAMWVPIQFSWWTTMRSQACRGAQRSRSLLLFWSLFANRLRFINGVLTACPSLGAMAIPTTNLKTHASVCLYFINCYFNQHHFPQQMPVLIHAGLILSVIWVFDNIISKYYCKASLIQHFKPSFVLDRSPCSTPIPLSHAPVSLVTLIPLASPTLHRVVFVCHDECTELFSAVCF